MVQWGEVREGHAEASSTGRLRFDPASKGRESPGIGPLTLLPPPMFLIRHRIFSPCLTAVGSEPDKSGARHGDHPLTLRGGSAVMTQAISPSKHADPGR